MGIAVEQIYLRASSADVILGSLRELLMGKGRLYVDNQFLDRDRLPDRDFQKPAMRYFVLVEYPNSVFCLTEAGDLADWDLASELARGLGQGTQIVALFESLNAWGHVEFRRDGSVNRSLFPEAAWREHATESALDWPGDATAAAWEYVEQNNLPNAFLSYKEHVLSGFSQQPIRVWQFGFKRVPPSPKEHGDGDQELPAGMKLGT